MPSPKTREQLLVDRYARWFELMDDADHERLGDMKEIYDEARAEVWDDRVAPRVDILSGVADQEIIFRAYERFSKRFLSVFDELLKPPTAYQVDAALTAMNIRMLIIMYDVYINHISKTSTGAELAASLHEARNVIDKLLEGVPDEIKRRI